MKKVLCLLLSALLVLSMASALAENTEAPRSYFPYPEELENLPDNFSLPDLFEFFDASADPNGNGRVDTPEEWEARRAELKDLLMYYLYGSRMDPLKSDTTVTAVRQNFSYEWATPLMTNGTGGSSGGGGLPNVPEGAITYTAMDWSAFGMGIIYSNIAPDDSFVYEAEEPFEVEGVAPWVKGDTWAEHTDAVTRTVLPTVTVEMTIRDTNPDNAAYVSEAATEGIKATFNIRFPAEPPVVDGQVRDPHSTVSGRGYPVVVGTGSLSEAQIVTLNNNGIAFIAAGDSADPDNGQLSTYEKLYPPTDPVVYNDNTIVNEYMVDSGDLMHTGWFISRALDAIENYMLLSDEEKAALNPNVTIPDIDVYASAVTGCSQGGKRAMVAGVFDTGDNGDTRFDIICPSDPGGGGASGYRYATEGQLFSYEPPYQGTTVHNYPYGLNETTQRAIQNTGEDQWFGDRAQILTVRPDLADNMPIDAHAFIAAFATANDQRYFLVWTGEGQDAWLNTPATVLNTWGAREAFEFLGQGDNIAVIVRDQAHANQDRDIADVIALMDKIYYGADKIVRKYHETLTRDGLIANDGNGAIMPDVEFDSIREMERNPFYIPSTYLNWSRPDKHVLWTVSNSVTEGVAMTFEFHSDAQKVELLLTDGETKLEAEVVDGIATIPLTADQAKAGRYLATAIGDKDAKSIEICGWTVSDALRHAISDNSALGHDAGSGICFTTPLVNYNDPEDAPRIYLNGEELPTDLYDYDNKIYLENGEVIPQSGYLQPYGATITLYPDTMGYNVPMGDTIVYSIRNAKIEALQGFVISMDVELEKYDPGRGRMRFKTTYNTVSTQTPVWEPELRQNTPKLGLPKGEDRWPILGNWSWDFDEEGNLKPIDEIRPLYTVKAEPAYKVEITVAAADANGFTIAFSEPVNKNDFAIAVNTVAAYTYEWAEGNQAVTVTYDAPVAAGTEVSVFVFRSVDMEGNMMSGPVALTAVAE